MLAAPGKPLARHLQPTAITEPGPGMLRTDAAPRWSCGWLAISTCLLIPRCASFPVASVWSILSHTAGSSSSEHTAALEVV